MRSNRIFTLLVLLIAGFLLSRGGHAYANHINLVEVKDIVSPGVQDFIEYAVERSAEEDAECLIIVLDTPGGLMTSMRGIVQAILNAPMPVVVYVYPPGAQAASAGVFITVAADIAAMAPGTNIGAAHPVTGSGEDISKTMGEKVVNDMVAMSRSIATQRGRNAEWLEDAIRKSVSIPAEEAFEKNVIDMVAKDTPALLEKLDGWEVQRDGYSKVLHTQGAELRTIEPGWRHILLRTISNPNIAYILLLIGLAGLYFELSQPGAVLPGVIGAISLVLSFYALQTLPVNYAGFIFIILAMIFFILEIKVTSYGMLSLAGIISLVFGSLMLFRVPGEANQLAMSVLVPAVLAFSLFFVAVSTLAFRSQRQKALMGPEALLGKTAQAKTPLTPYGKVFVEGELWNAQADESIPAGEQVEVVSVENLMLKVKRIGVK